ncbi:hypothetical protein [Nocardioides sp.]|uniref:hypothetical protein n=1 Tax=Nocardioides sp. TaxID=35761 RepID=UPI002ED84EC6
MTALAFAIAVTAVGCTSTGSRTESRSGAHRDWKGSCGPLSYDEVRGREPKHLDRRALARFRNDRAVCAGVWLRPGRGFVPQGLVVHAGTAWVSGFNAGAPLGERYCVVEQVDLRTGRRLNRLDPVSGSVGDRDPVMCRHGGGLVQDDHGLWLVETTRLWLVDPDSLEVRRAWVLAGELRGSFALVDAAGRLCVGRWYPRRPGQVDWFDTDHLVDSPALDLTVGMAEDSSPAPRATQGAVWGAPGGGRDTAWFAQSVTRCGVLVGPEGTRRRAFVPGAEGMDLAGRSLWVVSESGTRHYQAMGGRPVVPMLVRLELRDFDSWRRPDCSV